MTCTDDRLDDLDFPAPDIEDEIPYNDGGMIHGALVIRTEQPPAPTGAELYQAIVDALTKIHQQGEPTTSYSPPLSVFTDDEPWALRGDGPYQYCWCSPSRMMRFAASEPWPEPYWPEAIIYHRWEMPLPPTPSKELAVIQTNVS